LGQLELLFSFALLFIGVNTHRRLIFTVFYFFVQSFRILAVVRGGFFAKRNKFEQAFLHISAAFLVFLGFIISKTRRIIIFAFNSFFFPPKPILLATPLIVCSARVANCGLLRSFSVVANRCYH
jgi:hypothetical protein